ncbi:MAG: HAD family hydrolase [Clostridiales bacterium]|jgi:putative hydrolase of the HAD superfamily|nr:HAD family hydrolase [Clostridiales bacterium]
MIKGAVFDLDHTLFDRYATIKRIMPAFCGHFDIADGISHEKAGEMLEYADRNFVHFGWQSVLESLIKQGMFKAPPSFEEYSEFLLSQFRKTAVEFSFTKPMLQSLRERGYRTGLITNGGSETQRAKLRLLDLEGYFDEIIISGEFGKEKPSAEPFIEMSKRLDLSPFELIYVGDHPKFDIDASRKAGYTPILIKTTGTWVYPEIEKPSVQLDDVSSILQAIEKLNENE